MTSLQRRRDIKSGNDPTDLRRRRADSTISLRKQKKEQGLAKRRNTSLNTCVAQSLPGKTLQEKFTDAMEPLSANGSAGTTRLVTPEDVPDLTNGLRSSDVAVRTEAARGMRKVLSLETDPPVTEVIHSGAVPLLVTCLDEHDNTDLQFEAAWALTNIASTNKTNVVVENGGVPGLVRNLRHFNPDLREQCAWCLGNIAGDSAKLRDVVLGTPESLNGLLLNVTQPATESLLRNCVWSLSNMCRGKPQPAIEILYPALPILAGFLSSSDQEVLVDTCWALSYLSDGDTDRIAAVMSAVVVVHLTALLHHDDSNVVTPALRTLGNFVTGDDLQTQAVLDAGVLQHLGVLLHHTKKNIRKETCWTISNMVAGTPAQMAMVCDAPHIVPGVIEQLSGGPWEVQKEANFVVSNIATAGNVTRVRQLVEHGAIPALCQMLDRADAKVIMVALDALACVLSYDNTGLGFPWTRMVDECGGVERLEHLQEHENSKVYEKAMQIIERHFGCEDEDEDENLAPEVEEDGTAYSFGVSTHDGSTAVVGGGSATSSEHPICGKGLQGTPTGSGSVEFGSSIRTLNLT